MRISYHKSTNPRFVMLALSFRSETEFFLAISLELL